MKPVCREHCCRGVQNLCAAQRGDLLLKRFARISLLDES